MRDQPQSVVAAQPPPPTTQEKKEASNRAALAVLGGRFSGGIKEAITCADFPCATRYYTDQAFAQMRYDLAIVWVAKEAEKERKAAAEAAELQRLSDIDMEQCSDLEYVQSRLDALLRLASMGADLGVAHELRWAELFERSGSTAQQLRDMAFAFQMEAWAGRVERTPEGKQPRGLKAIATQAAAIFGKKAAWSERAITDAYGEGKKQGGVRGRPCSFPKGIEDELVVFITRLRELKVPVYKETVQHYAMRLLGPHEASLNFARIGEDGEYVRADPEVGGLEWDGVKLDHWYYRRFLGDRPKLTTGESASQSEVPNHSFCREISASPLTRRHTPDRKPTTPGLCTR